MSCSLPCMLEEGNPCPFGGRPPMVCQGGTKACPWAEEEYPAEVSIEVPNLDAMTPEELEGWSPEALPGVSKRVKKLLGSYAGRKRTAMLARLSGNIKKAVFFETFCDTLYQKLPGGVRW